MQPVGLILFGILFIVPSVWRLSEAYASGNANGGLGRAYSRKDEPSAFWSSVAILLVLLLAGVFMAGSGAIQLFR